MRVIRSGMHLDWIDKFAKLLLRINVDSGVRDQVVGNFHLKVKSLHQLNIKLIGFNRLPLFCFDFAHAGHHYHRKPILITYKMFIQTY